MAAAGRPWARELLYTWFNRLGPADWFSGSDTVDSLLERKFAHLVGPLGNQPAHSFLDDPQTARAAILLFDQIPRNLYRDSPRAFAWDSLARQITHAVLRLGWHRGNSEQQAQFILMPLMHSEDIADQRLSLHLFARYASGALSFARSHHRMIARFGRFPHRNAVLDRTTTAAEEKAIAAGFSW